MKEHLTVFVSGHLDVTPDEFLTYYVPKLTIYLKQGCHFIVGDANGADFLAQEYLFTQLTALKQLRRLTVVHMFDAPRNLCHDEIATVGGFTSDGERDDYGTAHSELDLLYLKPGRLNSGTAKNLIRRLSTLKK